MLTIEPMEKFSPEWRAKYEVEAFNIRRADMQYIGVSDAYIQLQIRALSDMELYNYIND